MRLEGKIALVTGAGGGIGRSVCERFLGEGARVAALDIDLQGATAALGDAAGTDRAFALACDVGDPDSVRDAVAAAVEAFGGLNTLVNVAGGSTPDDGPVTEAPEEEFWRAIRLDLFGTFLICKYGIPELVRAGGGAVVNTTSMMALSGVAGRDCYTAAKGGVASMTRSMAVEFGGQGVRVNAMAPGLTMSPRVEANYKTSDWLKGIGERHVTGLVMPVDVAHLAVYLASDEARVVTGQILPVDSGYTIS